MLLIPQMQELEEKEKQIRTLECMFPGPPSLQTTHVHSPPPTSLPHSHSLPRETATGGGDGAEEDGEESAVDPPAVGAREAPQERGLPPGG